MSNMKTIFQNDDFIVDYNEATNEYRVSYFEDNHFVDDCKFSAFVRHGRWYEEDSTDAYGSPIYRCSHCNRTVADNYISLHKYCLHCGARMDGGRE